MDIQQQIQSEILCNFPEGFFEPFVADSLIEGITTTARLMYPLNVSRVYVGYIPYHTARIGIAIRDMRWYIPPPPMTLYIFPDPCGEVIHTKGWIVSAHFDLRTGTRPDYLADMLKHEFLKALPDEQTARKLKSLIF